MTRWKTTSVCFLWLAGLAAAGCGGADPQAPGDGIPSGSAPLSSAAAPKIYCGTFSGDATGIWRLERRGDAVSGRYVVGDVCSGWLEGAITAGEVMIEADLGSASGTISTDGLRGTWEAVAGFDGTWEGGTSGCQ